MKRLEAALPLDSQDKLQAEGLKKKQTGKPSFFVGKWLFVS